SYFSLFCYYHLHLHSFPTRRSSDLHSSIFFTKKDYNHYHKYIYTNDNDYFDVLGIKEYQSVELLQYQYQLDIYPLDQIIENDSRSEEHTSELRHVSISYAVFCLKKK